MFCARVVCPCWYWRFQKSTRAHSTSTQHRGHPHVVMRGEGVVRYRAISMKRSLRIPHAWAALVLCVRVVCSCEARRLQHARATPVRPARATRPSAGCATAWGPPCWVCGAVSGPLLRSRAQKSCTFQSGDRTVGTLAKPDVKDHVESIGLRSCPRVSRVISYRLIV